MATAPRPPAPPPPVPPMPPQQNQQRPTNPAPSQPLPATQVQAPVQAPAVHTVPKADPSPAAANLAETTPATPAQERAAADAESRMAALQASGAVLANAVTALYGDSGTGKTSQVGEAIEYAWETFHRTGLVYHYDQGGFGSKLLKLAKLGIARIWRPRNHAEAFETAELCSLGYFPRQVLDLETGYADPDVELVPPQIIRWAIYCPNGHVTGRVLMQGLLDRFQGACPTCKTITTITNWSKVEREVLIPAGFKHIGLQGHDSVTGMADWIMEDMARRAAAGDTAMMAGDKNQLRHSAGVIVSGSMTFGSSVIAHYGFAQNRVASWLGNMGRVPRMVVPPIATFLENRGSDEANIPIYGPKIPGTARTGDVPAWVGNCFHLAKVAVGDQMRFRIWTTTHSSPNEGNIPHLAKHRGEPGDLPLYLEDPPDKPAFTTGSLKQIFVLLDQGLQRSLREAADRYPDAPNLQPPDPRDDQEELISSSVVSVESSATRGFRPAMPLPQIAGMVPVGQVGPTVSGGVPMPPGAQGVPAPPMMQAPMQQPAMQQAAPVPVPVRPPVQPLQVVGGTDHQQQQQPEQLPTSTTTATAPSAAETPPAGASQPLPAPVASSAAAPAIPPKTAAVQRPKRPPVTPVPPAGPTK